MLNNTVLIKYLLTATLLILAMSTKMYAHAMVTDTMTRAQYIRSQTVKADTLNRLALKLAVPTATQKELNQAIEYIMKGLHMYSKFRDTIGVRETFDHLALVYHLQKKYTQAKWFSVQSNSLSIQLKDTGNIINSLIALAVVKTETKDYAIARKDLHEAMRFAKLTPGITLQIKVEEAYADFYTQQGDSKKNKQITNRIAFLKDSVSKQQNAQKIALLKKQNDSSQLKLKQKQATTQKGPGSQRSESNHIFTTLIVGGAIAVTILLVLFYFKRKRR
ncbi:hypothetical protein BDD43_3624 [Mucilaginibacter gracilis]|uniref:Uncharacterized protein n=1 Tax=Mucilaginibacter gracilis TaxID=423350 RepID=A0A495J354_9SPHI|nr:hypothetical protein [Mucilaginibacter gracilis]RKR83416.1 hypothetical protein BDD43_3624 [Mucilaginibacter gracilis]